MCIFLFASLEMCFAVLCTYILTCVHY
jgi:hypothetical protein